MLGQEIRVFGDWFIIHFTENNGMAFGMEFGGSKGKLLLSVFRIVAISGIGYYIYHLVKTKAHAGYILCIALNIRRSSRKPHRQRLLWHDIQR